jgi:hypothetical protein
VDEGRDHERLSDGHVGRGGAVRDDARVAQRFGHGSAHALDGAGEGVIVGATTGRSGILGVVYGLDQ